MTFFEVYTNTASRNPPLFSRERSCPSSTAEMSLRRLSLVRERPP
uniref:Uncharacterized protein n=1 Tax=Picea sitchensis TaxID=3332 RepID=A9NTT3_PICSI|nr:unknown [Picea sitchensis]